MPISNTKHPRESDKVESELRRLILSMELQPGLSISESTLINRYGWGRTPLREACQRLAEQSLLDIVPRQGVVITPLSVFDFVEMMDAMSMVIGPAASLACKRLDESEIGRLEEILSFSVQTSNDQDYVKLSDLDYDFHCILANGTGNRYLSQYLLHLHQVATRFNLAAWRRDRTAQRSLTEHETILAAIQERDTQSVAEAMLAHIRNAHHRVIGTIETV